MADRYDGTGKHSSSQRQGRNDSTEIYTSLDELDAYVQGLRVYYQIDDELVRSFSAKFELPKNSATSRLKALSKDKTYCTGFLTEESYNMSIIDLHTKSIDDHKIIARFLAETLFESSSKDCGVMVVQLFFYDELKMLTPLTLGSILLDAVLAKILASSYRHWDPIIVYYKRRGQGIYEYHIIMTVLKALISRFLEECHQYTMHFVFSGIRPLHMGDEQRLSLARFMIDMGRFVRTVLPEGSKRKVKCVFSGDALFGCLFHHLESEKEQTKGNPEETDIFRQMLMLDWDKNGDWNNYYQRVRFRKKPVSSDNSKP